MGHTIYNKCFRSYCVANEKRFYAVIPFRAVS